MKNITDKLRTSSVECTLSAAPFGHSPTYYMLINNSRETTIIADILFSIRNKLMMDIAHYNIHLYT